jgi:hypothetical protein
MDSETGALIVGGTAGQAIVFELSEHCKVCLFFYQLFIV